MQLPGVCASVNKKRKELSPQPKILRMGRSNENVAEHTDIYIAHKINMKSMLLTL